ncbi:hypothetical protein HYZ99_00315 [Candidatus Peregrinibacteria bacterium]|nr:hypothetical protein [Candidatus Peregrinibacteria bacterium]
MIKRTDTSPMESHSGYMDCNLESDALLMKKKIDGLDKHPTFDRARDVAVYLHQFTFHITRALRRYGTDYENRGQKFIDLAERAVRAVSFVGYPECSQSIIASKNEIVRDVFRICRSVTKKTESISLLR